MELSRRLLLAPLLSPLLAALLLAALNPRPNLSLRLLIWRTPELPIGLWIGAGASGGALLSAAAAALALRQGASSQRRAGRGRQEFEVARPEVWDGTWRKPSARSPVASWFNRPREATRPEEPVPSAGSEERRSPATGPQRAPGEPTPTVAVPFRVLHRPSSRGTSAGGAATARPVPASAVNREAQPEAVAVADDWNQSEGDDW